ncbi:MAG: hypothetical protein TH68_01760 [Candidatus Synechococcus spongiarum 142]|uniref:Uncharacterized protein n=1 Tax=Candidatus Synechococcus spongiarum 142 TaxID=1608213 RepID=A0A6N3X9V6_9SYNE|nr:MAG: hypothetical protein TH68_01760 [Candidatus Synechococcus spongiarum 142]
MAQEMIFDEKFVETDTYSPSISEFVSASPSTLSANMGVSKGIATVAIRNIGEIEEEIEKIQGTAGMQTTPGVNDEGGTYGSGNLDSYLKIAEEAVQTLESKATTLAMELEGVEADLETAEERKDELVGEVKREERVITVNRQTFRVVEVNIFGEIPNLEAEVTYATHRIEGIKADILNQEYLGGQDAAQAERYERNGLTENAKTSRGEAQDHYEEANRLATAPLNYWSPTSNSNTGYAEKLTLNEMEKRLEDRKAELAAKQAELETTTATIMGLETSISEKETEITTTEENIETAKGYVTEIKGVLNNLAPQFTDWKMALGDDAAALENEKAGLVFQALTGGEGPLGIDPIGNLKAVTEDIAELDNEQNHVFARADKPAGAAGAMTFEEIVREDNELPIDNENKVFGGNYFHLRSFLTYNNNGTSTNELNTAAHTATGLPQRHPAVSLSDMAVANIDLQDDTLLPTFTAPTADNEYLDFHHGTLNGIEGTLYCDRLRGCLTSSVDDGEFLDGWYFTPVTNSSREGSLGYVSEVTRYADSDEDGTYEAISYIDYGMWLQGSDDDLILHRRAAPVGPNVSPEFLDFATDGSATYRGDAHGLSARTIGTGDDAVTASGHFEADVMLDVEFGASPTLNGTIDNFRPVTDQGSSHVDTGWTLQIDSTALSQNQNSFEGSFSVNDGNWNATPYGDMRADPNVAEPPAGFYGGFNAVWRNDNSELTGAAAGVYNAEKKE